MGIIKKFIAYKAVKAVVKRHKQKSAAKNAGRTRTTKKR